MIYDYKGKYFWPKRYRPSINNHPCCNCKKTIILPEIIGAISDFRKLDIDNEKVSHIQEILDTTFDYLYGKKPPCLNTKRYGKKDLEIVLNYLNELMIFLKQQRISCKIKDIEKIFK